MGRKQSRALTLQKRLRKKSNELDKNCRKTDVNGVTGYDTCLSTCELIQAQFKKRRPPTKPLWHYESAFKIPSQKAVLQYNSESQSRPQCKYPERYTREGATFLPEKSMVSIHTLLL
jgi:hypothetical protein